MLSLLPVVEPAAEPVGPAPELHAGSLLHIADGHGADAHGAETVQPHPASHAFLAGIGIGSSDEDEDDGEPPEDGEGGEGGEGGARKPRQKHPRVQSGAAGSVLAPDASRAAGHAAGNSAAGSNRAAAPISVAVSPTPAPDAEPCAGPKSFGPAAATVSDRLFAIWDKKISQFDRRFRDATEATEAVTGAL